MGWKRGYKLLRFEANATQNQVNDFAVAVFAD
jgi:hypothetical protein